MTARPILFSAPMIRALLEGRKTQTRRVVKFPTPEGKSGWHPIPSGWQFLPGGSDRPVCPYGQPGDLLWVRETITTRDKADEGLRFDEPQYRADFQDPHGLCFTTDDGPRYVEQLRWTPGIHMPRRASRLTLRITNVRVQRLLDISNADCAAEGIPYSPDVILAHEYQEIWEAINGPGSWDANPWVWALTFDVIKANVDEVKS